MCNWRRSLKLFSQVSQVMDVLEKQGYCFLFLTLTLRNCPWDDLPVAIESFLSGWRKLYHKVPVFRRAVYGTSRVYELLSLYRRSDRVAQCGSYLDFGFLFSVLRAGFILFLIMSVMLYVILMIWRSLCVILFDSSFGRRFFCKSGDISSGFFYGELTSKFS